MGTFIHMDLNTEAYLAFLHMLAAEWTRGGRS